jgi:acyl CoA:acetate/3-ketoacid CoA transferase beta subunit
MWRTVSSHFRGEFSMRSGDGQDCVERTGQGMDNESGAPAGSPGHRLRTVVTDLCVLDRTDGATSFELTALLRAGQDVESALAEVAQRTGFDYAVSQRLVLEAGSHP